MWSPSILATLPAGLQGWNVGWVVESLALRRVKSSASTDNRTRFVGWSVYSLVTVLRYWDEGFVHEYLLRRRMTVQNWAVCEEFSCVEHTLCSLVAFCRSPSVFMNYRPNNVTLRE